MFRTLHHLHNVVFKHVSTAHNSIHVNVFSDNRFFKDNTLRDSISIFQLLFCYEIAVKIPLLIMVTRLWECLGKQQLLIVYMTQNLKNESINKIKACTFLSDLQNFFFAIPDNLLTSLCKKKKKKWL